MPAVPDQVDALPILSEAEAQRILNNKVLRNECEQQGIDLSVLIENLTCTPEMRWKRHQNALRMAFAFKRAGQRARGE